MTELRIAILDAVPGKYWKEDGGITDGMKYRDLLLAADPAVANDIYYVAEGEWPDLGDYDAWLLTGSPCSVHDDFDWIRRLSDLLVDIDVRGGRLAACCFGHQLVAKTWGGDVGANEHGWLIGNFRLDLHTSHDWMVPGADNCRIYHFNRERVHRLPAGARAFARSEVYPDFAYTLGDNILCVQGHPEQPRRAIGNFLRATRHLLNDAEYERALRRIDAGEPDAALWGHWLANFLRG